MLTLDEIRAMLLERKLKIIAERTGLAYDTVRRIAYGYAQEPTYNTVKILSDYLQGESNAGKP
jgi:hypothetical protein